MSNNDHDWGVASSFIFTEPDIVDIEIPIPEDTGVQVMAEWFEPDPKNDWAGELIRKLRDGEGS